MNLSLITLLLTPFTGGILSYLGGKINSKLKYAFALSFSSIFIFEILLYQNLKIDFLILTKSYDSLLVFQINPLSWFFSVLLGIITLISVTLSASEKHLFSNINIMTLMFLEGASFGLFVSGDILTFFIFLCIILFITYILLFEIDHEFSLKFLGIYFAGAFSLFILLLVLFRNANSFTFVSIKSATSSLSTHIILFIMLFFMAWLFIMTTIFPLNIWIYNLYSKISGSSKFMLLNIFKNAGIYALILFFYNLIGLKTQSIYTLKIVGIFGTLTFISSTFLTLFKIDKEQIITHMFFAETGVSMVGISLISSYGFASSLLITINQLFCTGLFTFIVTQNKYNLDPRDKLHLNKISFFVSVLMILGVPFTIQFLSRWLLYTTLLEKNSFFYVSCIILGSIFEMVALYKLIKIKFSEEDYATNLSPKSSFIAVLTISSSMILTGIYPQVLLKIIQKIDQSINPYSVKIQFNNLQALNTLQSKIIFITLTSGIFLGFVLFTLIPWLKKKLPNKIILPITRASVKLTVESRILIRKAYSPIFRIKCISNSLRSLFNSFWNYLPLIQNKIKIIILYVATALALISIAVLIILRT